MERKMLSVFKNVECINLVAEGDSERRQERCSARRQERCRLF